MMVKALNVREGLVWSQKSIKGKGRTELLDGCTEAEECRQAQGKCLERKNRPNSARRDGPGQWAFQTKTTGINTEERPETRETSRGDGRASLLSGEILQASRPQDTYRRRTRVDENPFEYDWLRDDMILAKFSQLIAQGLKVELMPTVASGL
ncbi:hypothetical protein C8R44DRAFT_742084 [Mycena epipterygia]|nr:hypothetical protein C8R44DRAFT_742084 [Mycena epipterygia]